MNRAERHNAIIDFMSGTDLEGTALVAKLSQEFPGLTLGELRRAAADFEGRIEERKQELDALDKFLAEKGGK